MKAFTLIIFFLATSLQAATSGGYRSPGELCNTLIRHVEKQQGIPKNLLKSIALTESGRRDPVTKQYTAWPWTVMAEGKGRYYNSKQQAINAVRALRARGIKNIDMGCMQINYGYHSQHFGRSIENMLDPYKNITYSGRFLSRLKAESGLWSKAVGHYHSRTPSRSAWYQKKVFSKWRKQNGSTAVASYDRQQPVIVRGGHKKTVRKKYKSRTASSESLIQRQRSFTPKERQQLASNSLMMQEQRRRSQLKVIAYD